MMGPDDQHHTPESSRSTRKVADRAVALMTQHQDQILSLWLDAAITRIPGAADKGRAEIADHFIKLLQGIVHVLRQPSLHVVPDDPAELGLSGQASAMHGRERSSVEGYTLDQLAHEYILLRHVIVDFFSKRDLADPEVLEIINRIIEYSSLTAVCAFAKSMREIQRKLTSTLLHDVRTPLSVASTYAQLMALPDELEMNRQQVAETIMRSLKRAASMLEEVLDNTRLEAGQGLFMRFTRIDLNDVVRAICLEADQVYSVKVQAALEEHPVVGVFDNGLVTRTLENLISNAVKFGCKQAPVRVSVRDCGLYVALTVHNQGEPIPQDHMQSIFSFFSSPGSELPSSEKGWGLGLSLIKTVARNHGGEVILESTGEKGTTLGMTLHKEYHKDGEELSTLL